MSLGEKVIAEQLNSLVNYEDSSVVVSRLTMARGGLQACLHYLTNIIRATACAANYRW